MKLKITVLLLALLTAFSFVACTSVKATELSADYQRKAAESGNVTDDFIKNVSRISIDLLKTTITKDGENDLVSPLSALLCISLISNGADGNTKAQLEKLLGSDIDSHNKAAYAFVNSLYNGDDCKVNIANSIWFKENGIDVKPDFLQSNADWYDAQIYASPFDGQTVKDINNWCSKETDGMIKKIMDSISPDSMMFLINALSFDAKWQDKYEKNDIKDRLFTSYDGSKSTVDMLYSDENTYYSAEGFTGFSKSYKGNKYSFVGLLPNEGEDIYELVNALDGDKWLNIMESKTNEEVQAGIPEFTYDTEMDLTDSLKALGVTDLFSVGLADLSGVGECTDGNLYCSYIKQKAFIEVDRNGTKAAAITWGDLKCGSAAPSEPKIVILDRPFVYAIVDNATSIPLFIGVVSGL